MGWINALTDEPDGFKPRHETTDVATYARIQFEVGKAAFDALSTIAESKHLDAEGMKRIAQTALSEVNKFLTEGEKSNA